MKKIYTFITQRLSRLIGRDKPHSQDLDLSQKENKTSQEKPEKFPPYLCIYLDKGNFDFEFSDHFFNDYSKIDPIIRSVFTEKLRDFLYSYAQQNGLANILASINSIDANSCSIPIVNPFETMNDKIIGPPQ